MFPPFPKGKEFRHVPNHAGYAVTDTGEVWSCRRAGRQIHNRIGNAWKRLRPSFISRANRRGGVDRRPVYNLLRDDGRRSNRYACRLVLVSFVGPCPKGYEACHNDGNPENNRIDNLRWDSHKANQRDMVAHRQSPMGARNAMSKLTEGDVRTAMARRATGERPTEIAKSLGVTYRHLWSVLNGKSWKHLQVPPVDLD